MNASDQIAGIITRVAEATGWGTDYVRPGLAREMAKQILAVFNVERRTKTEPFRISCAVCGKACKWIAADPEGDAPEKFGGWYCEPCDTYSETDVE